MIGRLSKFFAQISIFSIRGLNTNNISNIKFKKTEYFDVSSGVENSEGIKDEKLISEFISKANKSCKMKLEKGIPLIDQHDENGYWG